MKYYQNIVNIEYINPNFDEAGFPEKLTLKERKGLSQKFNESHPFEFRKIVKANYKGSFADKHVSFDNANAISKKIRQILRNPNNGLSGSVVHIGNLWLRFSNGASYFIFKMRVESEL